MFFEFVLHLFLRDECSQDKYMVVVLSTSITFEGSMCFVWESISFRILSNSVIK